MAVVRHRKEFEEGRNIALSELKKLEGYKDLRKRYGFAVPRQVLEYQDGCRSLHHVLVHGRTREFLRIYKGHELPEWLEVLDVFVRTVERFRFSIEVPLDLRGKVYGRMTVDTSLRPVWSSKGKCAYFSYEGGYIYMRGKGSSYLCVEVTPLSKDKFWRPLVESFKEQVKRALQGEKVYGLERSNA